MNTLKKMLTSLLASVMLVGCASEDIVESPAAAPNGKGTVHFRLGGSAAPRTTRADETIAAEENERHIDNLYLMLWNMEGEYIGVVEAIQTPGESGEYDINIEKDGNYVAYFVANIGEETLSQLSEMQFDKNCIHNLSPTLSNFVFKDEIDANKIPMRSSNFVYFSSSVRNTTDLGTVNMTRHLARIDIINQADDVTITKIKFNNRTVKYQLTTPVNWTTEDNWYEDKEYDNLRIIGNSNLEEAGKYQHEIYTYRNHSTEEKGKLPTLTIEYETMENGKVVKKEHVVEFIDPNASGKTPLALKINNLYRVTLRKAHNLKFELSVNDWNVDTDGLYTDGLTITNIDLPSDVQNEMNSKLKVNMFTEYNVKSLNLESKQVELFNQLSLNKQDYSTDDNGAYFSYIQLKEAGLTGSDTQLNTLRDNNGKKYRLPTSGEFCLIFPYNKLEIYGSDPGREPYTDANGKTAYKQCQLPGYKGTSSGFYGHIYFASNWQTRWQESFSFKNGDDGCVLDENEVKNDQNGIISDIEWTVGGESLGLYGVLNSKESAYALSDGTEFTQFLTARPVYAVRFKGSSEYAAYKYEYICLDRDLTKVYVSVKIKALKPDADISVYDIKDNAEYWSKDYIEFKFPCAGYSTTEGIEYKNLFLSYVWTSSCTKADKSGIVAGGKEAYKTIASKDKKRKYPLRLVRVE